LRFGSDALRDDDFITDVEKAEDRVLLGDVTAAGFGGNGLGVSTDSLLRDRLRYSNNETFFFPGVPEESLLCENCSTGCPVTGAATGETALVTTGQPPPGDTTGFVLLLTGDVFTSLGSLGLRCNIPELFVAMVTTV